MAASVPQWLRRHRIALGLGVIGVLLSVVLGETFLLWQANKVLLASKAQSEKLLQTFLKGDTTQVARGGPIHIRLQNVRFKWSDRVYVDAGDMAMQAVPVEGRAVDFDDLDSFLLTLQQSTVLIRPEVLEGMLNESVFNYPNSDLRNLKVKLEPEDEGYAVAMTGMVDVVTWIPFSMVAKLSIDRATNTLVMDVDHMKVFGFLPATQFTKMGAFKLQRLITVPPNKSLMIEDDRIMVKPFALFPPPRVTGTMSTVTVDQAGIRLTFAGDPIPAPKSSARNYVYLRGGRAEFGRFCMNDTDILILDQNPATPFGFSLQRYAELIPRSRISIRDTRSVRLTMPDV
jgi:hypothetical protein